MLFAEGFKAFATSIEPSPPAPQRQGPRGTLPADGLPRRPSSRASILATPEPGSPDSARQHSSPQPRLGANWAPEPEQRERKRASFVGGGDSAPRRASRRLSAVSEDGEAVTRFSRRGSSYRGAAEAAEQAEMRMRRASVAAMHKHQEMKLDGAEGEMADLMRNASKLNPNDPNYVTDHPGSYEHHIVAEASPSSEGHAEEPSPRQHHHPQRRQPAKPAKPAGPRPRAAERKKRRPLAEGAAVALRPSPIYGAGVSRVSVMLRPEEPCIFREHAKLSARGGDTRLVAAPAADAVAGAGDTAAADLVREAIATVHGQHPHHCRISLGAGNPPGAGVDAHVKLITEEDSTKVQIEFQDLQRRLELTLHLDVELSMRKRRLDQQARSRAKQREKEREAMLETWRQNEERRQAAELAHQRRRKEWEEERKKQQNEILQMREREFLREEEMRRIREAEAKREEARQREREAELRAERRRKAEEEAARLREKEREDERRRAAAREQEWRQQERAREAEMALIEQERAQRDEERQKEKEAALQRKLERQREKERDAQWRRELELLLLRQKSCRRCEERELAEEERRCSEQRERTERELEQQRRKEADGLAQRAQLRAERRFEALLPAGHQPGSFFAGSTCGVLVCQDAEVHLNGRALRGFVHVEIAEGGCEGDRVYFLTRPALPSDPPDMLAAVSPSALVARAANGGVLCAVQQPPPSAGGAVTDKSRRSSAMPPPAPDQPPIETPVGYVVPTAPIHRGATAATRAAVLFEADTESYAALMQSLCFSTASDTAGKRRVWVSAAATLELEPGCEVEYTAQFETWVTVSDPVLTLPQSDVPCLESALEAPLLPGVTFAAQAPQGSQGLDDPSRLSTFSAMRPSAVSVDSRLSVSNTSEGRCPTRATKTMTFRVGAGSVVLRPRGGWKSTDYFGLCVEATGAEQDSPLGRGRRSNRSREGSASSRATCLVSAQGAVVVRGKKICQVAVGRFGQYTAMASPDNLTRLRLDPGADSSDVAALLPRIAFCTAKDPDDPAGPTGTRLIDVSVLGPGMVPLWAATGTVRVHVIPTDLPLEVLAPEPRLAYRLAPAVCRRYAAQRRRSSASSLGRQGTRPSAPPPQLHQPLWQRLLPAAAVLDKRRLLRQDAMGDIHFRGGFIEVLLVQGARKGDEVGMLLDEEDSSGELERRPDGRLLWRGEPLGRVEVADGQMGWLGAKHFKVEFAEDGSASARAVQALLRAVAFRNCLYEDPGLVGVRTFGIYTSLGSVRCEATSSVTVTMPFLSVPPPEQLKLTFARNEWTAEGIPVQLGGPSGTDAFQFTSDQVAVAGGCIRAAIVSGRCDGDVLDLGRASNVFMLRPAARLEVEDAEEVSVADWDDPKGWSDVRTIIHVGRDETVGLLYMRPAELLIRFRHATPPADGMSAVSSTMFPSDPTAHSAGADKPDAASPRRLQPASPAGDPRRSTGSGGRRGRGNLPHSASSTALAPSPSSTALKEAPEPEKPAALTMQAEAQACLQHLSFHTAAPPGVGHTRVMRVRLEDSQQAVCDVYVEVSNAPPAPYEAIKSTSGPRTFRRNGSPAEFAWFCYEGPRRSLVMEAGVRNNHPPSRVLICPEGVLGSLPGEAKLTAFVLTAEIVGGGDRHDRISIAAPPEQGHSQLSWSREHRAVRWNGRPIAHVVEVSPASLRVSFTNQAKPHHAQALLRAVCFWSEAEDITEAHRTARIALVPTAGVSEGCCTVPIRLRGPLLRGPSPVGCVYVERSGRRSLLPKRVIGDGMGDREPADGARVRLRITSGRASTDEVGFDLTDALWCTNEAGVLHREGRAVGALTQLVCGGWDVNCGPAGADPAPICGDLKELLQCIYYNNASHSPGSEMRTITIDFCDGRFAQTIEVHLTVQDIDEMTVVVLPRPLCQYVVCGAAVHYAAGARVFDADTDVFNGAGASISAALVGPATTQHDALDLDLPHSESPLPRQHCRIAPNGGLHWRDPEQVSHTDRRVGTIERRHDGLALGTKSWRMMLHDCPIAAVEDVVRAMTYHSSRANQRDRNTERLVEISIRPDISSEPTVVRIPIQIMGPFLDMSACIPRRYIIGGPSVSVLPDYKVVRDCFNRGAMKAEFDRISLSSSDPLDDDELLLCVPADAPVRLDDTADPCSKVLVGRRPKPAPLKLPPETPSPMQQVPPETPSPVKQQQTPAEEGGTFAADVADEAAPPAEEEMEWDEYDIGSVTLSQHALLVTFNECPTGQPHATPQMVSALVRSIHYSCRNPDALYVTASVRVTLEDEFGNVCWGVIKIDS